VLTGHGLKDPDTVLQAMPSPATLEPTLEAFEAYLAQEGSPSPAKTGGPSTTIEG
jgi:threonine synthase